MLDWARRLLRFATASAGRRRLEAAPAPGSRERAFARALLTEELAAGYKPNLPAAGFWDGASNLPNLEQCIQDVEAMLAHPRVEAASSYYKSGIATVEAEFEADSSETAAWARAEFEKFWSRSRPAAQRAYDYGRGGYEVLYEQEGRRELGFHGLVDFFPLDCGVLTRGSQYAGVRVRGSKRGVVDLWGPRVLPAKGFWFAHRRRYSRWYGWPQLYGAWRPWRRLAGRDGAEDIVDGGVYRFAFKPPIGRYPQTDEMPRQSAGATGQAYGAGNQGAYQPATNRDKMREMLEVMKSGGVVAFSSRRDEHGEYVWQAEFPDHALEVSGLLEYTGSLEDAICLGIGVPPELLQAAEVGSGYSGRQIPLEAFYQGQQANAEALGEAWREQIGLPLARWNFGPQAWFRLHFKPILETKLRVQQGAQPEGRPGPKGATGRGPAGAAAHFSTDAEGNEHRGPGPGGGQFAGQGGGAGGGSGSEKPKEAKTRPPGGAKRARRRAEDERVWRAYEQAKEKWEERQEEYEARLESLGQLAADDFDLWADDETQSILKEAEQIDPEMDSGVARLLKTVEGHEKYLGRARDWARLQVDGYDQAAGDALQEWMGRLQMPAEAIAGVKAVYEQGSPAVEKAAARFVQASEKFAQVNLKLLAHEVREPDEGDPSHEAWEEKFAALDDRASTLSDAATAAHDRLDEVAGAWGEKVGRLAQKQAEKEAGRLDREQEADEEPQQPDTGYDEEEPEPEVADFTEHASRQIDSIETDDEELAQLADQLAQELKEIEKASPDDHPDGLEIYIEAARDAALAFGQAGDVRSARRIRQTGAAALRALRALDDEGET